MPRPPSLPASTRQALALHGTSLPRPVQALEAAGQLGRLTSRPKTSTPSSTKAPRCSSAAIYPAAGCPATWPGAGSTLLYRSNGTSARHLLPGTALVTNLRATGYSDELIEASGLARRSRRGTLIDTFRDRAILPIRSTDGTIIAFIGRATDHAAPGTPKYLNSPATSVYQKGEILFGLWEARDALASGVRPVIVEGPLDAIAVTTAGHGKYVGLAPCGTALTAHQTAALARVGDLRTTGVTVAFDPDQAGRRATVRAYDLFVPHTDKLAAAIIPSGQDPAQILASSGPAALADMLTSHTRPLPDLVINTELARWSRWLPYPEGQIRALRATAPLVAAMPPAHVARQVARLAAILKLDHAAVTEAVTDALSDLAAETSSGPSHDIRSQRANQRPASITHATLPPTPQSAATLARAEAAAARRRESWRPPTRSRSAPRSG